MTWTAWIFWALVALLVAFLLWGGDEAPKKEKRDDQAV